MSPRTGQPLPPPLPPLKTLFLSSSQTLPDSRELQPSFKPEGSSATTPMSALDLDASPRPGDASRSSGDTSRQISTSSRGSLRSPPPTIAVNNPSARSSPDADAGKDQGRRTPSHSASQPQFQPTFPSGSSYHLQYTMNSISPSASNPLPPPPRRTSNPQYRVDQPLGSLIRPATAPDQPQFRAPSVPPNYPPSHWMNNPSASLPHSPSNERFSGPGRLPSDLTSGGALRKSSSALSLGSSHHRLNGVPPPMPGRPGQPSGSFPLRDGSVNFAPSPHMHQPHPRLPFPPPESFNQRAASFMTTSSWAGSTREPTPPSSPIEDDPIPSGPVTSTVTAQFKCKVFLQLHHGQWKSLGGGRLKLYLQQPTYIKQLVVEADAKDKAILISTIILTDGVERVGRTGVAIELSDKGTRTGIVYMIQLRNEGSASGLFDSLLAGSDRAVGRPGKA